ncbi:putative quinol monooxygenase [Geomesophilobacter sediminis]|uniref:Antibiotic biosynthesis monooxygenase n=1 Tax=Geomesophilobacter sediminis TaxID=2798584 RepID=A0A8J7IR09_9BACT|nr:hypothetical protein [Geomesophilobacter sediminis]MBJ6725209.1 hypothetical protein [Geomesophilobacter sediminis]
MVSHGLLVKLEAKPGLDAEVEELLMSLVPMVRDEVDTVAWFAIRFGRSEYGIFAAFPDEAARSAHREGRAGRAIVQTDLLHSAPVFRNAVILTNKLPERESLQDDTKGTYFSFTAKTNQEEEVEELLLAAAPLVRDEPRTTTWFALRFDDGEYGVLVTVPDNAARLAHLTGHAPRELAKHALALLSGIHDLHLVNVLAAKVPPHHVSVQLDTRRGMA